MDTSVQKQPLNTLTQFEVFSQEVKDKILEIDSEFVEEFENIKNNENVTKLKRLEMFKALSNKLVKVRTQSDLTKELKDYRKKIKNVSDMMKNAEDTYINGIRRTETHINEPLVEEKERIEKIEQNLKSITTYLTQKVDEVFLNDFSVKDLNNILSEIEGIYVLPEGIEEYDNFSFTKEQEALKTTLTMAINQQIKLKAQIEATVEETPVIEEESLMEDIFERKTELPPTMAMTYGQDNADISYSEKLISGANLDIDMADSIRRIHNNMRKNQLVSGSIDIDVAVRLIVQEFSNEE